jgi:hypothetical protein
MIGWKRGVIMGRLDRDAPYEHRPTLEIAPLPEEVTVVIDLAETGGIANALDEISALLRSSRRVRITVRADG